MKKIINGKLYDTETAKCVGSWDNGLYGRDFGRMSEELYKKKTGEFFLYGEGGPASKYAEPAGHGWTSGERIIPMTVAEAREWAEEHLDTDEYEEIFGEVSEDDSKQIISISVPADWWERVKRAAAEEGISASAYIVNRI